MHFFTPSIFTEYGDSKKNFYDNHNALKDYRNYFVGAEILWSIFHADFKNAF